MIVAQVELRPVVRWIEERRPLQPVEPWPPSAPPGRRAAPTGSNREPTSRASVRAGTWEGGGSPARVASQRARIARQGPAGVAKASASVADLAGSTGRRRVVGPLAVQGEDPEEKQLVDLVDHAVASRCVESPDRLPHPIRVVGYGELRQRRFDRPAGDLGVAAKSQQGEAVGVPRPRTSSSALSRISLVSRASRSSCRIWSCNARSPGSPWASRAAVSKWLKASSNRPASTECRPSTSSMPHLRLAADRGELGADQGVSRNPDGQHERRGDDEATAIPAEPANTIGWGSARGRTGAAGHRPPPGGRPRAARPRRSDRPDRGPGIGVRPPRGPAARPGCVVRNRGAPARRVSAAWSKASVIVMDFGRHRERPRPPHQAVEQDDTQAHRDRNGRQRGLDPPSASASRCSGAM